MKKLVMTDYSKFVNRPIFCEGHQRMTMHSVFFVAISEDKHHVLYFKYCNVCLKEAYEIQREYAEQMGRTFTEQDFQHQSVVEEMNDSDWKHLWKGDYYDKQDLKKVRQ